MVGLQHLGGSQISTTTLVTLSTTYYAQYTAKTYTVSFNTNGHGTNPSSKTVVYGGAYGSLPTLTDPEGHYDFQYWQTSSGTRIYDTTPYLIDGNTILYANWIGKSYTITVYPNNTQGGSYTNGYFDNRGGKFSDGTISAKTFTKRYGETLGKFNLINSNSNFIISYYHESSVDASDTTLRYYPDSVVTKNLTIYTRWAWVSKFKLTGDGISGISRIETWGGGRCRKAYNNPTSETLMEVQGGRILIFGKVSPVQFTYRYDGNYNGMVIGTGVACSVNVGNSNFTTDIALLALRDFTTTATPPRYHLMLCTDETTLRINSSGWIITWRNNHITNTGLNNGEYLRIAPETGPTEPES